MGSEEGNREVKQGAQDSHLAGYNLIARKRLTGSGSRGIGQYGCAKERSGRLGEGSRYKETKEGGKRDQRWRDWCWFYFFYYLYLLYIYAINV